MTPPQTPDVPEAVARPDEAADTESPSATVHLPDTVANAAATPDQVQPYAELGLRSQEYKRITELLGRRPTNAELAMYSVMWSEHCSYKSSKMHLRRFGDQTTPAMREHLLVGIGENAGVVDIGDGWAVTFKVESHNHPSYVEPYQGAATGVGGIVRDIVAMGARPVAVMDQLRFGDIAHPDTARLVHGVVAGIGGYGNSLGLPNVGGELAFSACYQRNPLVNALCVGVLRHSDIHLASAAGVGNHVILFGARTGGDGIGGASILASESFAGGVPTKRPSVQVGDPFMEKVIIECCLELFAANIVEGIQDLGAAGISCATSELASGGDGGMHIDLEKVLLRDPSLTAGEILMSESQERMMAVVTSANLARFEQICGRWEVEYAVIGAVTDTGRLTIDHFGHRIVDVDPRTVAHDGPVYDRPYQRPGWQDQIVANSSAHLPRPVAGPELCATLAELVASPTFCSPAWVTNQFDRFVGGNTALAMPDDAGVIRVDEETGLGVAIATDANNIYSKLDPYFGAQHALAESYRNVACTGARPLAITDCLNLGSPEDPATMWQLVETIRGLADACQFLGVPVTGGNVSLYNSTGEAGQEDYSIDPTPVVGVLGVLEDVRHAVPSGWRQPGLAVYLLGVTRAELDGSAWADISHGHRGGLPPRIDLTAERALADTLIAAAHDGLLDSAHDLSAGGLGIALSDSCRRYGFGVRVWLDELCERDGVSPFEALFSESVARVIVSTPLGAAEKLEAIAAARGVPIIRIGVTGREVEATLEVQNQFTIPVLKLRRLADGTLPHFFGSSDEGAAGPEQSAMGDGSSAH